MKTKPTLDSSFFILMTLFLLQLLAQARSEMRMEIKYDENMLNKLKIPQRMPASPSAGLSIESMRLPSKITVQFDKNPVYLLQDLPKRTLALMYADAESLSRPIYNEISLRDQFVTQFYWCLFGLQSTACKKTADLIQTDAFAIYNHQRFFYSKIDGSTAIAQDLKTVLLRKAEEHKEDRQVTRTMRSEL